MSGLNLTNFDPMLKEHYAPGEVANLAYQKNVALGLMAKSQKKPGGGREWVQPVQYSLPGGGSVDFGTALAATNNASAYSAFLVKRAKHYRLARVDNETIEATADGDMDAFEPAFDEFDKAIQAEGNYLNFRFFRSKGGYIGRMTNTGFATAVITLDDAAGVWAVRQGDVLNLANTDGTTGAIKTGSLQVLSVQRNAGTITCTGNISSGVSSAAANDYIFMAGDFGGAMSGLADWIPDTDPTSTLFFNVDRSVEPEMLGGLRVNGKSGAPIRELLIDMVTAIDNIGGDPNICFMNPRTAGQLAKQLEGQWIILKAKGMGGEDVDIGYKGYQVNLDGHEVTIYVDRSCQANRVWMLQMDTFTMFSAGAAPNFLQRRAGSIIKVSESADAYEARVGEYANFACKAPGYNCNGQTA